MTKNGALQQYFSSFGMVAYPTNAIPETAEFPYLTYDASVGNYGDVIATTVKLWYYTESEAVPNAKAEAISDAIGLGGNIIRYDGGAIWVKRGTPWCISQNDESNSAIKLRQLNIYLEFI